MIIAKLALMANAIKQAIPWQVWAILGAILLAWLWGNSRYDDGKGDERAKQDDRIAAAIVAALEAEREIQAAHEVREAERHTHTQDLKEAVAQAEPGQKVKAVFDALRNR